MQLSLRGAVLLGLAAVLAAPRAAAQTYVWNSTYGSFSDAASWQGGAPPPGGSPTVSLRFPAIMIGSSVVGSVVAINDLSGTFHLQSITSGTSSVDLVTSMNSGFQLDGANPFINVGRSFTMSGPINLSPTTGGLTIDGAPGFTAWLYGPVSGTGGLTIGANASRVTLQGANTFTGGVVVNGGTLSLNGDTAAGPQGNVVVFNSGSLDLGSYTNLQTGLLLNSTVAVTASGTNPTLAGPISGAGGLDLHTSGPLTIQGAGTYAGPTNTFLRPMTSTTWPAPTTLTFSGTNGSAVNCSSFNLIGGELILTNVDGAVNNKRLGDTAPINLRYSALTLNGANSAATSEVVGPISGAGQNAITVNVGSGVANTRLTAQSLKRVDNGTFVFSGNSLGTNANVLFTTPPTLVGGILPYAFYKTTNSTGLVTYDNGPDGTPGTADDRGIRPLGVSEYVTSLTTAGPTDNVQVAGKSVVVSPTTINSLTLTGGGGVSGSSPLTVASGAVVYAGAGTRVDDVISAPVAFGSTEANLFTAVNVGISSSMSGTGGLTKSGSGTLTLRGANSGLTGALTVNGGLIAFDADVALPGTGPIHVNSEIGQDGLSYVGPRDATVKRGLVVNDGYTRIDVAGATGRLTYGGPISGNGGLVKTGPGMLVLPTANTFSGPVKIGGPVVIAGDSSLGTGSTMILDSGSLALSGDWTTSRLVVLNGATAIDTRAFNATLSGRTSLGGSLTKLGPGTLSFTGTITSATSTTSVSVNAGTLRLAGNGASGSVNSVTVNPGATLLLDHTASPSSRLFATPIYLNNATLAIEGNSSQSSFDSFSSSGAIHLSGGNTISIHPNGTPTSVTPSFFATTNAAGAGSVPGMVQFVGTNFNGATGSSTQVMILASYSSNGPLGWATVEDRNNPGVIEPVVVQNFRVRPAQMSDYTPVTTIENPTVATTANIRVVTSGQTAGSPTVNALRLGAGAAVDATSGTLTVGFGGVFVEAGPGTATVTGPTTGNALNGGALYFTTMGDLNVTGTVNGINGVFKTGPGTLTLAGATAGGGAESPPLTVAGGMLKLTGPTYSFGKLEGGGTLHLANPDTTLTLTGGPNTPTDFVPTTITGPGKLVLSMPEQQGTYPHVPPVVYLSAANSYSGGTTINGTTAVVLSKPSALGVGPVSATGSGYDNAARIGFDLGEGAVATVPNAFILPASVSGGAGVQFYGISYPRQTVTLSGEFTGGSASASIGFGVIPPASTYVSGGLAIPGSRPGSVFRLTNPANSFRASIEVWGGETLAITSNAVLGDPANLVQFWTSGSTLPGSTPPTAGLRLDAGGIDLKHTVDIHAPASLDTNSFDAAISGQLTGSSGPFGLTKLGGGKLTLSNVNNTYAGPITVAEGALLVNGGISSGTSPVTVAAGALLGGTGTIGRPVTVQSGGTLAPGASPGVLSIGGAVTLSAGSTFAVELNGTTAGNGYDQLDVLLGGSIDLGGATLSPTAGFDYSGQDLAIVTAPAGGLTGTFAGLADGSSVLMRGSGTPSPFYVGRIHYDPSAGTVTLQGVVPVPEPASLLLAGSVAGAACLWRWRRTGGRGRHSPPGS